MCSITRSGDAAHCFGSEILRKLNHHHQASRFMQNHFTKAGVVAIALFTCHGCITIPVPIPVPIPVDSNPSSPQASNSPQAEVVDEKYQKTCYADALTESQGKEVTESSSTLESTADKLAIANKHQKAIKKYNEAAAAALNEEIADGSIEDMEISAIWHSWRGEGGEGFKEENRQILQKSAEINFKIGSSYARLRKYEQAIDCFSGTIKFGILPPNDAIAYLNRGDAYERMGDKVNAKADFQQAVILFKKHKQPTYYKLAQERLQAVK